MIFMIFLNFSFLENSNLVAGSCFKKFLRLVVCKTSFYLFKAKKAWTACSQLATIQATFVCGSKLNLFLVWMLFMRIFKYRSGKKVTLIDFDIDSIRSTSPQSTIHKLRQINLLICFSYKNFSAVARANRCNF